MPRRTLLALLSLLLVAAALRGWATDFARFTGDESDYWAKSRWVATGDFVPVYGPEITGTAAKLPGPAYYYLMAVPQALSASPRAGSYFVVGIHVLAGLMLFALGRRARGDRAGLLALALFAVAPWDVLYADRIWGSCVVPAWGALSLYAAVRARDSGVWQATLLFSLLVLPQLHLSVPVLWAACGAILLLRPPKKWHWGALAIGLVLTVLAYGPPLLAELRSDFANSRTILAKGGGAEPWDYATGNPLRVLGYMVLYGSSEIGYHFARGYWGGGFDNAAAYFSGAGWSRFFEQHGAALGAAGAVSILLSLVGWLVAAGDATKASLRALVQRRRDALDLDRVLTVALLVGFVGGGLLLMLARKRFFPHYANILMPIALWPIASGLDRLWAKAPRPGRLALGAALALSLGAMVTNVVRYYRTVDGLNGLGPTLAMVEHVLEDGARARIDFTHFRNTYAWNMVARTRFGRDIPAGREVRWRVVNHAPHTGEIPAGAKRFGPVLLQRTPPEGRVNLGGSRVRQEYRRFAVDVVWPDGRTRACGPFASGRCAYGDEPWRHFGPETMTLGGQPRPLLFLHPVQGATVRAAYPVASEVRQGQLRYGLSDGAVGSNNRAPVKIRITEGDRVLATAEATNRPGLHALPFTRTATRAGAIRLEIETENEGARIFGFDLELK